jgi:hypothetical protein
VPQNAAVARKVCRSMTQLLKEEPLYAPENLPWSRKRPFLTRGYKTSELRIYNSALMTTRCSQGLRLVATPKHNTRLKKTKEPLNNQCYDWVAVFVSKKVNSSMTTRLFSPKNASASTLLSFPRWNNLHGWLAVLRRTLLQNRPLREITLTLCGQTETYTW